MKDKLIFGKNVKTGLHEIIDPVLSPGTLFVGGVGSGVDIAARFTVAQRFASNSHQDLYIFSSPLFGKMEEFSCFFAYKKNAVKAFSLDQLIDVVDMIYVEIVERKKAFLRLKVNNIYEYENVIKEKYPDLTNPERFTKLAEEWKEFKKTLDVEEKKEVIVEVVVIEKEKVVEPVEEIKESSVEEIIPKKKVAKKKA
jgi:hypothetical protein